MSNKNKLEEGAVLKLDFKKVAKIAAVCPDVIPVVIQDAETNEVILLAYTNEIALRKTLETGTLTLWSTSRNELWEKGKESGNTFQVIEVRVNCEQNSLLYKVKPNKGKICHTRNSQGNARNCFYRRLDRVTMLLDNLDP